MSDKFLRRAIFFGLGAFFIGMISRLTIVDLDLYHQMALIREVYRLGYFPQVDLFSYLHTVRPLSHHEWGNGALIYLITVQSGLGTAGLMFLKYLLAAFVALGCFVFATRQGASLYVFSAFAPLGIGLGWCGFTTIRAQLFSICFLLVLLFLLEEDRKGKRWPLWAWLFVYLIWLNMHGSFLVGLGLLAIYLTEKGLSQWLAEKDFRAVLKTIKRPALFLLATACLTPVNPEGVDYLAFMWNALTLDHSPFIPEWNHLWIVSWGTFWEFICSFGIVAYCFSRKDLRGMPGLFLVAATAVAALDHYRQISLYAVAWMCYAPAWAEKTPLGDLVETTWSRNSGLIAMIFLTIGISGISYATYNRFWHLRIPTTASEAKEGVPVYPVGAADYLKDRGFSGNLMVPYNAGAYISWKLYPKVKVGMDSRFDMAYTAAQVKENILFYDAHEDWQETLFKYRTDGVLVPVWSKLARVLTKIAADPHNPIAASWKKVYMDDGYSLYLRSELAKRFPLTDMRGKPITACFP